MSASKLSRRMVLAGAAAAAATAAFAESSTRRSAKRSQQFDVIVLGAGISGLHAARMLQTAGASVLVLEGSGRVGGRVWSANELPGKPEFGAEQIGVGYGRVRANAAELGVPIIPAPPGVGGETRLPEVAVSMGGAPPTADFANSPMNLLASGEKNISPIGMLFHYLLKDDPLDDLQDWLKPEFAWLDKMSVRDYCAQRGASPEALRIIDHAIPAWTADEANALDFVRKNHYYLWDSKHGNFGIVRDGTGTLTDAMAASLRQPVQLNKIVAGIHAGQAAVTVTCRDGSSYTARACINTIPPTVLRDIPVSGAVNAGQIEAWRRQRSDQSMQIVIDFKERFWEKDGLPPAMWTDGPFEVLSYKRSRVDANGLLRFYVNGKAVAPLNRMSDQELRAAAVAELVRLRPAAAGLVSVGHIHNWSTYPFAKGHIAYTQPGDIARYGDLVGKPMGCMYFAGEHNSRVHAGLEGACEASENAVISILEKLGKA